MALYDGKGNKIQIESGGSTAVVNSTERFRTVRDTTVRLYQMDSRTRTDGGIESASSGIAVSAFYEIPEGYTGGISGSFKVSDEIKGKIGSPPAQLFLDDAFVTYWSTGSWFSTDGREFSGPLYYEPSGPFNKVRFTIPADHVDDFYAYLTQDGKILFAGKNTPYYGMTYRKAGTVVHDNGIAPYSGAKMNILQGRYASGNFGMDAAYVSVVEEAKNAWMLEHNGDPAKIPLILHTDQHGVLYREAKNLPWLLTNIVPWQNVSKIINLGDTIDSFYDLNDSENGIMGSKGLSDSFGAMSVLPAEKQIHVFGNHEFFMYEPDTNGGLNQYYDLNTYGAQRFDENGFFVVKDGLFNVKYVGVSGFNRDTFYYQFGNNGRPVDGAGQTSISKESMDWLIGELERDDGYDVVIVSHYALTHVPTDGSGVKHPDLIENANYGDYMFGPPWGAADNANLDAFWAARKNKTAGTVYDSDGNAHDYDFTKVRGNFLCGLHGHSHDDNYCYINSALLDVTVDCMYNTGFAGDFGNTFHFVLIDRRNNLLNVWKVDGSPKFQNYQIPLDKPEE